MKLVVFTLLIAVLLIGASCQSGEKFKSMNVDSKNLAINGFDTVSYFDDGLSAGDPKFSFVWKDATWHFKNGENLEKFKKNPEQYAPQFGGYCSWAVSQGYTANGDPNAWKIVDGKLYLNYNLKVKEKWEADQTKLIGDAVVNWEKFKTNPPTKK